MKVRNQIQKSLHAAPLYKTLVKTPVQVIGLHQNDVINIFNTNGNHDKIDTVTRGGKFIIIYLTMGR